MNTILFLLAEILKGVLRIEKKVDEMLGAAKKANNLQTSPFNFKGQSCPLCLRPVRYIPVVRQDATGFDTIRVCGCSPQPTDSPMREEETTT